MVDLSGLGADLQVAVIGQGGIGHALAMQLLDNERVGHLYWFSRKPQDFTHEKLTGVETDITSTEALAQAFSALPKGRLQLVIVATGVLQDSLCAPEKRIASLTPEAFMRVMSVNALAPMLVAQAVLPYLDKQQPAVFAALSARVGSISDNRLGGWYSYRASKAALNMLLKCLALETRVKLPKLTVLGLHPGTVATALSEPFRQPDQAGVFTPTVSANYLLQVIAKAEPSQSGKLLAWDGQEILP